MASTEIDRNGDVAELKFKSSPDVSMDGSQEDHSQALNSFDNDTPAITTETCTWPSSTANLYDDNTGESDNDFEELVEIDENSIPSIIAEICPIDRPCIRCEIEQPCSFRFTGNGETLYVCNEPCIKAYQAEYPGKYTITRKKYLIEEITPKILLCSECEEKKTCYFYNNFGGEDTYYCSLNCLEGMMSDEKDKYAFKLNSVNICIDQIRPKEGQCLICEKVKPCEFSLVRYGESCFLCERNCIKILSGRERRRRYYIKKLKVSKPAVSNAIDKHFNEGYKIQEKTAAMFQREQSFHRRCSQCTLILIVDENVLTWEAMDFCDEICLERFLNGIGSRCAKCNSLVQHTSLGKYSVRFGYDIRQFCNSSCLEEFKKESKICCYCQRDILACTQVFLAPVGDKEQSKDFCARSCLEKFDKMSKNSVPEPVWAKCAVCSLEKATTIEMEVTDPTSRRICSDLCFAAYKFVNNIFPDQCKWCKKYFERKSTKSFTTYDDDSNPNCFCSLSCMNIYINHTRFKVSCNRCKAKKYNFNMIRRVDNDQAVMMCSLNCLSLYQESANALTSSKSAQRGRGVRVRGGRGRPPPVVMVEEERVGERGGSSGRRPRARGVRGTRHKRPGPSTIDELRVQDISELPEGQGLETALRPKRMRMGRPSIGQSRPGAPPSTSGPPPSPSTYSMPSPARVVECDSEVWDIAGSPGPALSPSPALPASPGPAPDSPCSSSSMQHLPPPPRRRPLGVRNKDIIALINYGSENDSESDDEEGVVVPGIPRAYSSVLETPLDQDLEDAAAAPAADPAPDFVPPTATDQPWSWTDFDWKDFPASQTLPNARREIFSNINVGPTTPRDDPYAIFIDIWDRQIMEHIVSETNKYAQQVADQMIANNTLQPASRIARWQDVTVDEFYVYFGIVLAMGVVVKSRVEEYWSSTPDIFYTPGFSAHMSADRYLIISRCLHFNDNDNMCALGLGSSEAKLYKIEPIVSHLNKKFQELYIPAQNIALDESLLMWKGWLEMSQLIPNKAAKKGIKTYEICESQTGYLWRFEVHAHKKTPPQHNEDPLAASTPSIVLRLIEGLEYKGYTLWMDNFYNSPCLARRLKSLGVDCVGTLRTDRKFVPQALHSLTKRNMRQGDIAGFTSGDVDIMVWRDTNRVSMISTYHGNRQQTIRGSTKPTLILDYNIMMGGVDKKDQLLAMYPVERKRSKVWYKKLFKRLLNISILNSYVIYKQSSPSPPTHRNFRVKLIKSLLSIHSAPSAPSLPPAPTNNIRIDVTHRLAVLAMGTSGHQRLRRRCAVCKKKIHTFCVGCSKTVCLDPCFRTLHL